MIQIPVTAFLSPGEEAALTIAIERLNDGLQAEKATVSRARVDSADALSEAAAGNIRILSLASELERLDMAWPEVEAQLRHRFETLTAHGDPVLLLTLFRHVDGASLDEVLPVRVRIRRLNLLAADLSREYGVFVVDLDRVLADVGGARLQSDYRLQGQSAAELAGHTLATVLAGNALDAFVPFEAQERVLSHIAASHNALRPPADLVPKNLLRMGKGRRRQIVSTNSGSDQEDQAARMLKSVLKGQMSVGDAVNRFVGVVQRRGAKQSLMALTSGVTRLMGGKE